MNSITQIVKNGLCAGCGTCAGVCPTNAIEMRKSGGLYVPVVAEEKCTHCAICVKSCPGHLVDFQELNSRIFGSQPRDFLLGNYLGCYVGHATDNSLRYASSSGGLATQLLIYALESNLIDGALVARMRRDNPLETEPLIARTSHEVISASKSKYCPVAANEGLRQVLKEDGRFAVVGLPCHIHGVRKAERLFPALEKRIVLHVGLMCSHTVDFRGTEFLLGRMNVGKEQVGELSYRGSGWPGSLSIRLKNGAELAMPYLGGWNAYWSVFSSFFFCPVRCSMCPDLANELADISLGDAWLPELMRDKVGESIVLTRTKTAEDILGHMKSARVISMRRVDPEKARQSQTVPLKYKKNDLSQRLSLLRAFGRQLPEFIMEDASGGSSVALLRSLFSYANIRFSRNDRLQSLLARVPLPLFRLYYGIFKALSMI